MSNLGTLATFEKLAMSTFQWHRSCGDLSSGHQTAVFRTRASRVISLLAVCFLMTIPSSSGTLSVNWDNQVVDNLSFFKKVFAFWTTLVQTRKISCAKIASKWAFLFQKYLAKFYKCRVSFRGFGLTSSFQVHFESVN